MMCTLLDQQSGVVLVFWLDVQSLRIQAGAQVFALMYTSTATPTFPRESFRVQLEAV
jgi:hypothetical protein